MVNFEGRVQRVARCHLPAGRGPSRLAHRRRPGARPPALEPPPWTAAADVLQSLAESVAAFRRLNEDKIGPLGTRSSRLVSEVP